MSEPTMTKEQKAAYDDLKKAGLIGKKYEASQKAKDAYAMWQRIERIIGAGYAGGRGLFSTDARFEGLTKQEAVCKVLDNEDMQVYLDAASVKYAADNDIAKKLFKLWQARSLNEGVLEKYSEDVQALFNRQKAKFIAGAMSANI